MVELPGNMIEVTYTVTGAAHIIARPIDVKGPEAIVVPIAPFTRAEEDRWELDLLASGYTMGSSCSQIGLAPIESQETHNEEAAVAKIATELCWLADEQGEKTFAVSVMNVSAIAIPDLSLEYSYENETAHHGQAGNIIYTAVAGSFPFVPHRLFSGTLGICETALFRAWEGTLSSMKSHAVSLSPESYRIRIFCELSPLATIEGPILGEFLEQLD